MTAYQQLFDLTGRQALVIGGDAGSRALNLVGRAAAATAIAALPDHASLVCTRT